MNMTASVITPPWFNKFMNKIVVSYMVPRAKANKFVSLHFLGFVHHR